MTSLQPREDTDQLPYVREDDWDDDQDLPARPVRKRLGPWSLGLIGAVIAAGAFYGGVVTEKHHIPSTVSSGGGAGAAGRGAAAGGTGTGGARTGATGGAGAAGAAGATAAAGATGAGGAGATFGTVKLVDGNNVYVQDSTGNITKVATTPQSTITVTSTGTVKSIKPGDTVIVRGAAGQDGVVNATAITDAGSGGSALGGFGGGGFFRRGGGGAGAAGAATGAGGGGAAGAGAGGGGGGAGGGGAGGGG